MLRQHKSLLETHPVDRIQASQSQPNHGETHALTPQDAQPGLYQLLAFHSPLGIGRLHEQQQRKVGHCREANPGPYSLT